MVDQRRFLMLLGAAFLLIGVAAYASVLSAGFLADDWLFLGTIAKAEDMRVVFTVWSGRFMRPIVAVTYYLSYRWFGLATFPAHLALVLLHVLNAWLISVLVLRLAPPPNRLMAAGAGLLFLSFSGHSEAVSWVAGLADPALVPFLIIPLLLLDRAAISPRRWLPVAWMVGACGLLAKESAMILPAIAGAYGMLAVPAGADLRKRRWVTAIFCAVALAVSIAYLLFRVYRVGSAFGAYDELGNSRGQRVAVARMFLVRLFVPAGRLAVFLWVHYLDVLLIAGLALALLFVAWRHRADRGPLAFVICAAGFGLAPVLPLGLSLATTISERYLYVAAVFTCILTAWTLVRILPSATVAGVAVAVVAGAQCHYLQRSNRIWLDVAQLFDGVVAGIERIARERGPLERTSIVLLNMPDAVERPFLGAGAAGIALRLRTADPAFERVRIASMHEVPAAGTASVQVQQRNRQFRVTFGGTVSPTWIGSAEEYAIVERTADGLTVFVNRGLRRALVASWTRGDVRLVADLPGGVPLGSLDLPAGDADCQGTTLRFAGWALDDEEGVDVLVQQAEGSSWRTLGPVEWHAGTRPDVNALFADVPGAERTEWNYRLPCEVTSGRAVRIRVAVRDRDGHEVELGTRAVRGTQ